VVSLAAFQKSFVVGGHLGFLIHPVNPVVIDGDSWIDGYDDSMHIVMVRAAQSHGETMNDFLVEVTVDGKSNAGTRRYHQVDAQEVAEKLLLALEEAGLYDVLVRAVPAQD
jgi:hypothetical protein